MNIQEYIKHHDELASEEPLFNIPIRKEYLLKQIGHGKTVLDLGCLGGQISKLIKDQNNEVYGVEIHPRAADLAKSRGIKVKVFDLNEGIPFEDGFFDVVNAGQVLETIYDTKFLFEECNRVLKPQGLFFFSTQNLNSFANRMRVLTGGYLARTGAYPEDHHGIHIRVFNISKIKELCRLSGFRILDIVGIPHISHHAFRYWILKPVVSRLPQMGELLIVKAQRVDQ